MYHLGPPGKEAGTGIPFPQWQPGGTIGQASTGNFGWAMARIHKNCPWAVNPLETTGDAEQAQAPVLTPSDWGGATWGF